MKKVFYLFLILLVVLIDLRSKENLTLVFNQEKTSEFYEFILLEVKDIDTNNFEEKFKNIEVLKLYPVINKIYVDKIKKVYAFKNIESFKNEYLKILEINGYYKDYNYYLINPIKIEKVLVNTSELILKQEFLNYKLDMCSNLDFKCIKLN